MAKFRASKSKQLKRPRLGISVRKFGYATWNDIDSECERALVSSVTTASKLGIVLRTVDDPWSMRSSA